MTGPRHAVHILAHQHPALFGDLVASLEHPQIDVFAHIDARVGQAPFARAARGRVRFTERRYPIRWGGFNIVRATQATLDAAAGGGYHRHSLLSGADVRLQPLDAVLDAWSDDRERIRIDRRIDVPGSPHRPAVSRRHFPDAPWAARVSGRIPRSLPARPPLMQGSQWWSLTEAAVGHVRHRIATDRRLTRFFQHALCSDELIVHTILADSPFAERIAETGPDVHGQHFLDWSEPPHLHPVTLTHDDLPRALASGALFARKVGPEWTWRGASAQVPVR